MKPTLMQECYDKYVTEEIKEQIMTNEQIEQNAEIRVFTENSFRKEHKKLSLTPSEEKIAKDFYIAGAHSRDEEIEQLRNPWISVKDRLPKENETVLLWLGGVYKVALLRDCSWWECTGWQIEGGCSALDALSIREVEYLTHWMPISPELNND